MGAVSQVTISGTTYDVYGTTADIKAYLAGRLGTDAYDDATSSERNKAHVQATRWIDSLKWSGIPTDTTTPQPLAFPRTGLTDCDGLAVDDQTVPDAVCDATAELVLVILDNNAVSDSSSTANGVKRVGAGSATVEFFSTQSNRKGSPLPPQAWRLLSCFAAGSSSLGGLATGTDAASQFDDCDRYDVRYGGGFP